VHCAAGGGGSPAENSRVNLEGARNVCETAVAMRVRLIHFSTFSVYGDTPPGVLTEDSPRKAADPYGRSKLEAERLVQSYQKRGVEACILQPTIVYGPWSFWSTHVTSQLRQGAVALPDGGAALCNAVYVDDVIQAVLLALSRQTVAPGPFLISGAEPITWRDYYSLHGGAIPGSSVVTMTAKEWDTVVASSKWSLEKALSRKTRFHLKGLILQVPGVIPTYRFVKPRLRRSRSAVADNNVQDVSPRFIGHYADHLGLLRSQTAVRIARARTELGYSPEFASERAVAIMAEWLRWAAYAPRQHFDALTHSL
jgi:nucleoside-diphosphate-sugar epimerase